MTAATTVTLRLHGYVTATGGYGLGDRCADPICGKDHVQLVGDPNLDACVCRSQFHRTGVHADDCPLGIRPASPSAVDQGQSATHSEAGRMP